MSGARVILVDDHRLVRAGLRALVDGFEGISVIGEADDGAAALELVRREPPEVVITDITMKGTDGLELALILRQEFPQVRVIVLSMHAEQNYVEQALRTGISGYLLKDAAMHELEFALRTVLRGDTYLSPAISKQVVAGYAQASAGSVELLTARQREILTLIAQGSSAKEIAYQLDISTKTVEAHRAQIMERLHLHDVPALVKFAIQTGLISLR